MSGSCIRFSESVLDGANLFSFSQLYCEKLKRFAPSKAVPGFSDGVTMRSYIFFLNSLTGNLFTSTTVWVTIKTIFSDRNQIYRIWE